jgi:ADP-ribose pyrophosphatase YjhB (NUDIX family)
VARHPDEPAEGGRLALPGGYAELGQTLANAAVTEVQEETGYSIIPGTLGRFAILDGPTSLPGRTNEHDLNIVHVYFARAGAKVQEHDSEVTEVRWITQDNMPPREEFAFGHFDIIRMWYRHQQRPFEGLPIVPSGMDPSKLFLADNLDR